MKNAFSSPPKGLVKVLLGLPRFLYWIGLGWLLGHRFLLLTHRGRCSRHIYQTVLEVVRYNPLNQESIVIAAWGEQTEWYRNLLATGAIMIQTGGRRYQPDLRFLAPEEAYAELQSYLRRNRWATCVALRLFGLNFDSRPTDRQGTAKLRGVAFRFRR